MAKLVTMKAHVAAYCAIEGQARKPDDLFLAYREHVSSGPHLDHLCRNPSCIYVDHLEPVTPSINMRRKPIYSGM